MGVAITLAHKSKDNSNNNAYNPNNKNMKIINSLLVPLSVRGLLWGSALAHQASATKPERQDHTPEKMNMAGLNVPLRGSPQNSPAGGTPQGFPGSLNSPGSTIQGSQTGAGINGIGGNNGALGKSCLDFPLFLDDFQDGCAWYLEYGCSGADIWVNNDGVSAADACCICGGGTDGATVDSVATANDCRDVPGFFDVDHDGCELYALDPAFYCEVYGDHLDFLPGLTANVACCACGGGIRVA